MSRAGPYMMLAGAFIALSTIACMEGTVGRTTSAVGALDLVTQCRDLQDAKDAIRHRLHDLSQDQRDRLREINAIHRVTCTADLRALAAEVRDIGFSSP